MRTNYRIDDFQEGYFVLNKLEDLLELAEVDFGPLYQRLETGPEYAPGEIIATDTVVHRGDGRYHQARKNGHPRGSLDLPV